MFIMENPIKMDDLGIPFLLEISVVLSLPFNLGAGLGAHCATGG